MHRNTVRRQAKAFVERRFISIRENRNLKNECAVFRLSYSTRIKYSIQSQSVQENCQQNICRINEIFGKNNSIRILPTRNMEEYGHFNQPDNYRTNNTFDRSDSFDTNETDSLNTNDYFMTNKQEKLASWAIAFKQTRASVNSLLKILREDEPLLPKDYRTLCRTPRKASFESMDEGFYYHLGLKRCLTAFFVSNDVPLNDVIYIDVNVDGVPVAKSSKACLWPILINIVNHETVLLVGTYFGKAKPSNVNSYLKPFVEDFLEINRNGLKLFDKIFHLKIRYIVADAPARAFLLNIQSHTGYFSCHKCIIKGKHYLKRMTFAGVDYRPRTDINFRNKTDKNHHKNNTPLVIENISDLRLVTQVPIDYMHAVLLGVLKYLLRLMIKTRGKPYSLTRAQIRELSARIILISSQLPNEFSRKVRGLDVLNYYKAVELRQLLLYVLPIAFKGIVKPLYFDHFMKFSIAIRILCSPRICIEQNSVAYLLLRSFVKTFPKLYGLYTATFNLHSLLHMPTDVKYIGESLDAYSAFKFENYLQLLKREAKCGYRIIEQISNRNAEAEEFNINKILIQISNKNKILKRKKSDGTLEYIKIYSFLYSTREPNNFVFLEQTSEVIKILKIYDAKHCSISFSGCKLLNLRSIFETPIQSAKMKMYETNNELSLDKEKQYTESTRNIKKVVKINIDNTNYLLKMLH